MEFHGTVVAVASPFVCDRQLPQLSANRFTRRAASFLEMGMTATNLPGGMTDGPSAVLTTTALVSMWLDAEAPGEWQAPDGSAVYRFAFIDLDYQVAYLLRVVSPETSTADMVAVFVRHGRHPVKGWNLDTEWWMRPVPFFDQDNTWLRHAHEWFVRWVFARCG